MEARAILKKCPLSPRKMRLVADQIRGMEVTKASGVLASNNRMLYSGYMLKLLKSATSNWMNKNENATPENLIIKTVFVDEGVALKRLRTAPQGRAHRIKKRSNQVTLVVDNVENMESSNNELTA
jgi:large subunit ribosomal protein L22